MSDGFVNQLLKGGQDFMGKLFNLLPPPMASPIPRTPPPQQPNPVQSLLSGIFSTSNPNSLNSQMGNLLTNIGHTGQQYAQNQIINPIVEGVKENYQHPSPIGVPIGPIMKVGQGLFNASPPGMTFNTLYGGITSLLESARTKQPISQTFPKNLVNFPDIARQGLGVKNPLLAGGINLAAPFIVNPEMAAKSGEGIISKLTSPQILKSDVEELSNAFKTISQPIRTGEQVDLKAYQGALDFMQDFKNAHKIPITDKQWTLMNPLEQHQILFSYIKNRVMGGTTFGLVGNEAKPTLEGMAATPKSGQIENPMQSPISSQQLSSSEAPSPNYTPLDVRNLLKPQEDQFIKDLEANQFQASVPPKEIPRTTLPTDTSAQYGATIQGGGFTGKVDPEIQKTFADWVNQRRATKVEGMIKQKDFADLNSRGLQGILDFQAGENTGRMADVKSYFDNKYNQVKEAGVDLNYKNNYLPQLFKNTQEEIQTAIGRRLGLRPSFSLPSVIKDYQEGIKMGLTPRFNTIGELAGWYEKTANKVLADKGFFDYLAKDGYIQPSGKAPTGWKTLSPDSFPKVSVTIPNRTEMTKYSGTYSAPGPLADMINNYLSTPEVGSTSQQGLSKIANFMSSAKNRLLSFGIPNTGINFHGFNILARSFLEGGPLGAVKTAYYMVRPNEAEKFINANLGDTADAIRSGIKISASERTASLEGEKFLSQFGSKWNDLFERPLFDKVIAAKKVQGWTSLWKDFAKSMPENEAKSQAAKFINTVYGGINWEELGRSRDIQNAMRVTLLTPDWLESNLRLGGGIVKSLFNPLSPQGAPYRKALTYFVASYAALNIANKLMSGHYMYQNDTGHAFDLESGFTADGQKRYIRPYGTAVDFARIPIDIAIGLIKGDPTPAFTALRNRLSTGVGPLIGLLSNTNYKGQPLYGQGLNLSQTVGGIGGEVANLLGFPSFASNLIDTATGKQGVEQGVLQAMELPVRYTGGPATKNLVTNLQSKGASNQDINQQLNQMYQYSQAKTTLYNQQPPELQKAIDYYNTVKGSDPNAIAIKDLLMAKNIGLFNYNRQLAFQTGNQDPLYTVNPQIASNYLQYQYLNKLSPGSDEEKQYYKNHPEVGMLAQARSQYFQSNPIQGQTPYTSIAPIPSNRVRQLLNTGSSAAYRDPEVAKYMADRLLYINQMRQNQGLEPQDQYGNILGSKNYGVTFGGGGGMPSYAKRAIMRNAKYSVKSLGKGTKIKPFKVKSTKSASKSKNAVQALLSGVTLKKPKNVKLRANLKFPKISFNRKLAKRKPKLSLI